MAWVIIMLEAVVQGLGWALGEHLLERYKKWRKRGKKSKGKRSKL